MIILAFETSCDDTSVAIFDNQKLLFMDTVSQIKIHNITGWVVPEVAAREHANAIFWVLENVLYNSKINLDQVEYIAVTKTPGLMPSLLTWLTVAKTLWNILQKEVIEINHIEAHIFANFLEREENDIKFPLVCLTVSGWHNEIYFMKNMFSYEKLWWTTDDSAWEAFDKVAKMMGLEYPGWPIISQLASEYIWEKKTLFPRVWLVKDEFDFSFSWLKSSAKREIDKRILEKWSLDLEDKRQISFEFQEAVIEVLSYKLANSAKKKWVSTMMLAWWVSANELLNNSLKELASKNNLNFISPVKKIYCMDNAAMVGINTYYKIKRNEKKEQW